MGSVEPNTNFKKVQQFKADYTEANFTQYESQRTGLNVVVVDRKGPKIYGYFALATEIHDDSGARTYSLTPRTGPYTDHNSPYTGASLLHGLAEIPLQRRA